MPTLIWSPPGGPEGRMDATSKLCPKIEKDARASTSFIYRSYAGAGIVPVRIGELRMTIGE
jgi:hypothetical protein